MSSLNMKFNGRMNRLTRTILCTTLYDQYFCLNFQIISSVWIFGHGRENQSDINYSSRNNVYQMDKTVI